MGSCVLYRRDPAVTLLRIEAWCRLASELPMAKLDAITTLEPLSKVKELSEKILAGQVRGRVVLDVNA